MRYPTPVYSNTSVQDTPIAYIQEMSAIRFVLLFLKTATFSNGDSAKTLSICLQSEDCTTKLENYF